MEANSETHNRTLVQDRVLLLRKGRKDSRRWDRVWGLGSTEEKNQITSNLAHENLQNLNQHPWSLTGNALGHLHLYNSYVAWFICGTPRIGSRSIPGTLTVSWEPISHVGLFFWAWIKGEVFGRKATWYAMFWWIEGDNQRGKGKERKRGTEGWSRKVK